jgi:hypothetical protein
MALLFGLVVMFLWNWLMPVIFALPVITFWQAWGLVLLSHILFKSFNHSHRPHPVPEGCDSGEWKDHFRDHMHHHWRDKDVKPSEEKIA